MLLLNILKFWYKPKKLKKTEKLFAIGTENLQILNIGIWYRTYTFSTGKYRPEKQRKKTKSV